MNRTPDNLVDLTDKNVRKVGNSHRSRRKKTIDFASARCWRFSVINTTSLGSCPIVVVCLCCSCIYPYCYRGIRPTHLTCSTASSC
eukprot:scaffold464_cov181-Amphora_coffeaeformis.AAC.3